MRATLVTFDDMLKSAPERRERLLRRVFQKAQRKKPFGHKEFTRRTKRGTLSRVPAKGVKPMKEGGLSGRSGHYAVQAAIQVQSVLTMKTPDRWLHEHALESAMEDLREAIKKAKTPQLKAWFTTLRTTARTAVTTKGSDIASLAQASKVIRANLRARLSFAQWRTVTETVKE